MFKWWGIVIAPVVAACSVASNSSAERVEQTVSIECEDGDCSIETSTSIPTRLMDIDTRVDIGRDQ